MSFRANGTGIAAESIDGIVGKAFLASVQSIGTNLTLSDADRRYQLLTPTGANRDVTFPSTGIVQGETWVIQCASGSSFALVVKASNGSTIATLNPGEALTFATRVAAPTASTDWTFLAQATQLPDGSLSVPSLRFSGASADTGIYSPGTDQIAFSQNGVQTLIMSALGAATIGPATGLSTAHTMRASLGITDAGPGTNTPVLQISNNSQTVNTDASPAYLQFSSGNSGTGVATIGGVRTGINSAKLVFGTHSAGTFLRSGEIEAAGSWVFGPAAFAGNHRFNGSEVRIVRGANTDAGFVSFYDANGTTQRGILGISRADGTGLTANGTANSLVLYANGVDLQFSQAGVLVGNVSTLGAWVLGPVATNTVTHILRSPGNAGGTPALNVIKANVAINSSGNSYIEFYGTASGFDGYLGVLGTTLQVVDASDARKKENVRPADYGLSEILALNPVVFDWKAEYGGETDVKGFLAQEVKLVLPECVDVKDESGTGGFVDSHFLGTATMIPVLVKAIQELSARNDALEARLAALEGA